MGERIRVLHATCAHCDATRYYAPTAMHLDLLANGVTWLEFFCTTCHEHNRMTVGVEVGELLAGEGVATTFVDVPLELLEHPLPGAPAITSTDVARLEDVSLEVFNRVMKYELGDRRVGGGDVQP